MNVLWQWSNSEEVNSMKGAWKVTSNLIDDIKLYQVYRQLDTSEVDHSGNREYYKNYITQDREVAEILADELNQSEKKKTG